LLALSAWDGWQPVTQADFKLVRELGQFAMTAKRPLRPFAVLSPDHLAATRAQLGPAGFVVAKKTVRRDEDRRPLSVEEVRRARELAA
jgi:hypothetical protein